MKTRPRDVGPIAGANARVPLGFANGVLLHNRHLLRQLPRRRRTVGASDLLSKESRADALGGDWNDSYVLDIHIDTAANHFFEHF